MNEVAKKLIDEAAVQAPHEIPMMLGISIALADYETAKYMIEEISPKMTEAMRIEKMLETAASLDRKAALAEEAMLGEEVVQAYKDQAQGLRDLAPLLYVR